MSDPNENLLVKQQKYRAQRIDHDYHKKPHAGRSWMRILTIVLPAIGIAVIAALTFNVFSPDGHIAYEPGPVSNRHIWFNHRCEDCHEKANGKFGVVTNAKCRACHDGPLHNANQVCPGTKDYFEKMVLAGNDAKPSLIKIEEPRCATCHTEHKGSQQLVEMPDNNCTQCHADLKVKDGKTAYSDKIVSFMDGHQEWRVLKPEAGKPAGNDPTKLRFNHSKHMKVAYDPYSKYGARTMECVDCHKTNESNLETMRDTSPRVERFEQEVLKATERDAYYDKIADYVRSTGVVKYKLTRLDMRKLAVETFSMDKLDRQLGPKDTPETIKAKFETALIAVIRERLGNTAASGQNRYMVPITYERNCASECHKHEIKAAGIVVPHGAATDAREYLRNTLYPETVKQTLSSASLSEADKAKMKLIAKYRAELLKQAGKPLPPSKADADKLLAETATSDDDKMFETLKTAVGEDEMIKMLAGDVEEKDIKGFEKLKGAKKKKFIEALGDAVGKLIASYVDDKPVSAASIDAALDAKLKEGLDKIFGKADDVRNKNERGACLFCHEPSEKKAAKPEEDEVVADTNIPARWLNHAIFNHETHRVVECESCHAAARTSEKTTDVLLPGIKNCQQCHNHKEARMDCIECHLYHDKTHQMQDRTVPIEDLMTKGAAGVKTKDMKGPPKTGEGLPPPAGTVIPKEGLPKPDDKPAPK